MYKNRITLIGFLGNDAEVKTFNTDQRVTILSLATQESWKDRESGEYVRRSEWHKVVCWGRLGEFAASLLKGAHLEIEGTLRSREYKPTAKRQADDKAVRVLEVRAESILKLDRAAKAEPGEIADAVAAAPAADQEAPF